MVRRVVAAVIWVGATALLGLASWLTPSSTGMGTHTQLNLPQCGWIMAFDLPCPTCGMTTAFAHAAHGNLAASFIAQPMGCLLAIATAMAWIVSLYVLCTGSRVASVLGRLWGVRAGWIVGGLFAAAWAYKILSHKGAI